jgi:TolB-like protein
VRYLLLTFIVIACSSPPKKTVAIIDPNLKPPFEKIAESLSKGINTAEKRVLVITFIGQDGNPHKYGQIFAEKLTTELVKTRKMIVLDRFLMYKKIQEKGMSIHSTPDLDTIRQLSNLLNLDAVAIGIVTPFTNGYELNCRMIDSKSGLILSAEESYFSDRVD